MADINRRVLQGHPERQAIYEYIKAHRGLTTREIADALPYDREVVIAAIRKMDGFVIRGCGRTVRENSHRYKVWEALR